MFREKIEEFSSGARVRQITLNLVSSSHCIDEKDRDLRNYTQM